MPPRISAFPKCYIDQIAGARTMSVFDWIDMARALDADGLEMYDGFFTSLEPAYLDQVGAAIRSAGCAMPMLCCSPDFTNPDADGRKRALDREVDMIRVCRRLGGPKSVCRVLSGQRYPEVGRDDVPRADAPGPRALEEAQAAVHLRQLRQGLHQPVRPPVLRRRRSQA